MNFRYNHTNLNVADMEKSLAFFKEALDLTPARSIEAADGSFRIVYLTDGESPSLLELTCLRDHPGRYELGENESHVCFTVDDYAAAFARHQAMGCVCFVNEAMGLYFIEDPDGYWFEVVPAKR